MRFTNANTNRCPIGYRRPGDISNKYHDLESTQKRTKFKFFIFKYFSLKLASSANLPVSATQQFNCKTNDTEHSCENISTNFEGKT